MPLQVSHRIRRRSVPEARASLTGGALPWFACMSSTSPEAGQKNRCGLTVVPTTPTTTAAALALGVKIGQTVRSATCPQGT